jgi:hypothetical protein
MKDARHVSIWCAKVRGKSICSIEIERPGIDFRALGIYIYARSYCSLASWCKLVKEAFSARAENK